VDRFNELRDELRLVLSGRGAGILDALIPLLVYLVANRFLGLNPSLLLSLAAAALLVILRLFKKQSLAYALGGGGSALLAGGLAYLSGTEGGFYLPGFITGGLTVLACLLSALLKKPLAAYSSRLTRRWPADWYWHPRVLPAYIEVTVFWALAFWLRLALELYLFARGDMNVLGAVRLFMGWPYTILVLVITYLYGLKRLQKLGGPSVAEFKSDAPPPWQGQQRGF
jgi:hypothetical protein